MIVDDIDEETWDENYFLELAKNIDRSKLSNLQKYIPNLRQKQKEILSKIKPNQQLKIIITNRMCIKILVLWFLKQNL